MMIRAYLLIPALFMAFGNPAVAAACVKTEYSGAFCTSQKVFGPKGAAKFELGEITALDPKTLTATWNGNKIALADLASMERGEDCKGLPLPPKAYLGTDGRKKFDGPFIREIAPVCVGDQVTNTLETGLVLGKFPDGHLLFSDGKLPPRRVAAHLFRYLAENAADKHDLVEAVDGFARLNELLKSLGADEPCEPEVAQFPPVKEAQARCEGGDSPLHPITLARRKHFEALLVKGAKAPIGDFLELWNPGMKGEELDSPYFACEQEEGGRFTGNGWDNNFSPECVPDVLYSWGPRVKLDAIRKNLADGKKWQGYINSGNEQIKPGAMFTSISAVSTFGYGPVLVRLKIKPGTPGRWSGAIDRFEDDRDIRIRDGGYNDFIVRNASVVESFSYGTPEIYDEVVRDILRFRSGKRVSIYTRTQVYQVLVREGEAPDPLNPIYNQAADLNVHDELSLKLRLLELIRQILASEGRVHFNEGVCKSRARHYATKNPSYINPYPLAAP